MKKLLFVLLLVSLSFANDSMYYKIISVKLYNWRYVLTAIDLKNNEVVLVNYCYDPYKGMTDKKITKTGIYANPKDHELNNRKNQ